MKATFDWEPTPKEFNVVGNEFPYCKRFINGYVAVGIFYAKIDYHCDKEIYIYIYDPIKVYNWNYGKQVSGLYCPKNITGKVYKSFNSIKEAMIEADAVLNELGYKTLPNHLKALK